MSDRANITTASDGDARRSDVSDLALLLARRELWLLVSVGFVDPFHRQRTELLKNPAFRQRVIQAAGLLAEEHSTVELGPGELEPRAWSPRELFAAQDAEADSLEATYRKLFGLTAVSPHCPSCEVEYELNADVTYRAHRLADVSGFYQAFGLDVSAGVGERLDHITVEAEFIYVLLAKEAAAFEAGNQEGAEICREARRKFFEDHVGWWMPALARILSRIAPAGYYRELARLTAALSAIERVSLGIPPFTSRVTPKVPVTGEGAMCDGCHSLG